MVIIFSDVDTVIFQAYVNAITSSEASRIMASTAEPTVAEARGRTPRGDANPFLDRRPRADDRGADDRGPAGHRHDPGGARRALSADRAEPDGGRPGQLSLVRRRRHDPRPQDRGRPRALVPQPLGPLRGGQRRRSARRATEGPRHLFDTVNTNILGFAGRTLGLVEAGSTPVEIGETLETLRYTDFDGTLQRQLHRPSRMSIR